MGRGEGKHSGGAPTRRASSVVSGQDTVTLAKTLGLERYSGSLMTVDDDAIDEMAAQLNSGTGFGDFHRATWDNDLFWIGEDGSPEDRAQFYTIGNAINFRFWELQDQGLHRSSGVIDGKRFGGAMYMWRALRRSLDDGRVPLLDASFLENMTQEDFDLIFKDDDGHNPLHVGADDRIANLRDLGRVLNKKWDGQFLNVARAADGSLVEFSKSSEEFRAFDDPVLKLTMLNAIMLSGSKVNEFRDEPLPAIDYHLIRHAVRQGMVVPGPETARKLEDGELLDEDEAVELRGACMDAYLQLSEKTGLSGEVLDNKYWHNRAICGDPAACKDPEAEKPCPFQDRCQQRTGYGLPLEITRHY